MADLNFDFSSYPKPVQQKSLIDQVQGLNQIDLQQQAIQQNKLDQANQALTYMTRAMGSLGPNASKEDYARVAQNAVDQGLVPQQQENIFLSHLQKAPDSQSFYKQFMSAAMDQQHQIALHTGINTDKNDNATQYQGKTDVLTGGFKPTTQAPIQPSPTTPNVDQREFLPNGEPNPNYLQRGYVGAGGPSGFRPSSRNLSNSVTPMLTSDAISPTSRVGTQASIVGRGLSGAVLNPLNKTKERVDLEGTEKSRNFNDRFGASFPNRIATEPPPLFDEGRVMKVKDQELATQKLTSVKPLLLAIDLIKKIKSSGPGTDVWTKGIAGLKSNGIIPTDIKDDPTAINQEINKYLAQSVGSSPLAQRSDAGQALADAGNPNLNTQILPALLHLSQVRAAQERIEAARSSGFGTITRDDKGRVTGIKPRVDLQNYGSHSSKFPASMDERAFMVDMMTPDQKKELYQQLQDEKKNNPAKYNRFRKSLEMFKATQVGG